MIKGIFLNKGVLESRGTLNLKEMARLHLALALRCGQLAWPVLLYTLSV